MAENLCPQCGAPLAPGATECKYCGEAVAPAQVQPQPQPQPQYQQQGAYGRCNAACKPTAGIGRVHGFILAQAACGGMSGLRRWLKKYIRQAQGSKPHRAEQAHERKGHPREIAAYIAPPRIPQPDEPCDKVAAKQGV